MLPDGQGEAAAGVVHAEKDHGHVLRGAHAPPQRPRVTVIHVALVQRQRMILGAGELLSFHHPAIKHLHRTANNISPNKLVIGIVVSRSFHLNFELRGEI